MILVFLFMAGYYFMDSPSQRVAETELEYVTKNTDLRSIAECTAAAHTAAIKNYNFDDICTQQYQIISNFICLNEKQSITKCEIIRNKKPESSFIVTSTVNIPDDDYNNMLEILEKYYPNTGTFGIFMDDFILSGGSFGKRAIAKSIIKGAELSNGQLVYVTQYELPDIETDFEKTDSVNINCGVGTIKTYRFGRWQCIANNEKSTCNGDNIWDYDTQECIPDNSRKPLCGSKQTAVMVDDLWECIDPFLEKNCPTGMIARLNYSNLEWECIEDPSTVNPVKKCSSTQKLAIYGTIGSTLRIPSNHCTDCEKMITDSETCVSTCVPDTTKLSDPKCYLNPYQCSGSNKAFYFGFPNSNYVENVSVLSGYTVPFNISYSQNRKFNCIDCGDGYIDSSKSFPPYIAICE
ncbi:MAG: hypothetical protein JW974_01395 [Alphaproteobacteria bacterium]|nr:hypothetical protein [Alphaproteobacteria bacterium]MBN2675438.1 hypothetical protein [Alphaproteobacteria bacterium]